MISPRSLLAALVAVAFLGSPAAAAASTKGSSSSKSSSSKSSSTKSSKAKSSTTKKASKEKCSTCARDKNGKIARSEDAKRTFMKQTGYTKGRKGYVVDHIVPLACGGKDEPSNMQWQTKADAKAKDKVERKGCS